MRLRLSPKADVRLEVQEGTGAIAIRATLHGSTLLLRCLDVSEAHGLPRRQESIRVHANLSEACFHLAEIMRWMCFEAFESHSDADTATVCEAIVYLVHHGTTDAQVETWMHERHLAFVKVDGRTQGPSMTSVLPP